MSPRSSRCSHPRCVALRDRQSSLCRVLFHRVLLRSIHHHPPGLRANLRGSEEAQEASQHQAKAARKPGRRPQRGHFVEGEAPSALGFTTSRLYGKTKQMVIYAFTARRPLAIYEAFNSTPDFIFYSSEFANAIFFKGIPAQMSHLYKKGEGKKNTEETNTGGKVADVYFY